jgi:hypothetical protein
MAPGGTTPSDLPFSVIVAKISAVRDSSTKVARGFRAEAIGQMFDVLASGLPDMAPALSNEALGQNYSWTMSDDSGPDEQAITTVVILRDVPGR